MVFWGSKNTKVVRREVVSLERYQPQPLNLGEEVRSSNEHHQGPPTNADQEGMEEELRNRRMGEIPMPLEETTPP